MACGVRSRVEKKNNKKKTSGVVFIPDILVAESTPFLVNSILGSLNGSPHLSRDVLGNQAIHHALKRLDSLV